MISYYISTGILDPEFALVLYYHICGEEIFKKGRLQGGKQLTTNTQNGPGESRAVSYSKLKMEDLRLCELWLTACRKARKKRRPMPAMPSSMSIVAKIFLNDVKSTHNNLQHTPQHCTQHRVYGFSMDYNLGPATFWFTISPQSIYMVCILAIVHFGVDPKSFSNLEYPACFADVDHATRVKNVSDNPSDCVLFTERLLQVVMKYIVGWDTNAHRPMSHTIDGVVYSPRGLLGSASSTIRSRLAHSHAYLER